MAHTLALYNNVIVWLIAAVAALSYTLTLRLILAETKDAGWRRRVRDALPQLRRITTALPLLGLLGTVSGLLTTFQDMSTGYLSEHELLSSGIADAMFTTQIGLLTVIPGLLLLARLRRELSKAGNGDARQVARQDARQDAQ